MTDMMVGMLFIFIILLMSFALLFRHKTDVQVETTKQQSNKIEVAEAVGRELDETESRISKRLDEIHEATEDNDVAETGPEVIESPTGDPKIHVEPLDE